MFLPVAAVVTDRDAVSLVLGARPFPSRMTVGAGAALFHRAGIDAVARRAVFRQIASLASADVDLLMSDWVTACQAVDS